MDNSSLLLKVDDLTITFKTPHGCLTAVDKVSLEIENGESVAIVGESGCGKSTLGLSILGLLNNDRVITDGKILFSEQNLLQLKEKELQKIRGHLISMVFQDPMTSLNPYLQIGLQVYEQISNHLKLSKSESKDKTLKILEAVGLTNADSIYHRYPHEFSGGMRQRTLLASALSCSPRLLIADEPTTALDVTLQSQILSLIRAELEREKMGLLLITHDLAVVAGLCERIYIMYAGKIVEEGTVEAIFSSPRHPYTKALLALIPRLDIKKSTPIESLRGQPPDLMDVKKDGCIFENRCPCAREECKTQTPILRIDSNGRKHRCLFEEPSKLQALSNCSSPENIRQSTSEVNGNVPTFSRMANHSILYSNGSDNQLQRKPLLSIRNLVVHYDVQNLFGFRSSKEIVKAVNHLSLNLKEGEILGLVGESGCGKSTLVKTILGLVKAKSGKIFYENQDLSNLKNKKNIQLIFQDPYSSLNPKMRTWKIIAEPLINFKMEPRSKAKILAREIMEKVGLNPDWAERYPYQFSGGQRQRIGIARALIQKPKILLCDEPVSALDVSIQAQILSLLRELQIQFNLSIIFISHDLSVVRYMADRVAIMYEGRIIEDARPEIIYTDAKHPYTKILIDAIPIPDPKVCKTKWTSMFMEYEQGTKTNTIKGCDFAPRCPKVNVRCKQIKPELQKIHTQHYVACLNWNAEQENTLCGVSTK